MFKIVNWNQRAKDDFFEKRSIENSEEYVAIVSYFLLNKVDTWKMWWIEGNDRKVDISWQEILDKFSSLFQKAR